MAFGSQKRKGYGQASIALVLEGALVLVSMKHVASESGAGFEITGEVSIGVK